MSLPLGTWSMRVPHVPAVGDMGIKRVPHVPAVGDIGIKRVPHVPAVGDMGIARSATFHEPFTYAQLNNTAGAPCPCSRGHGYRAKRDLPRTIHRGSISTTPFTPVW